MVRCVSALTDRAGIINNMFEVLHIVDITFINVCDITAHPVKTDTPDKSKQMCLIGIHRSCCVAELTYNTVIANYLWQSLQCAEVWHNTQIYFLHKHQQFSTTQNQHKQNSILSKFSNM